MMNKFSLSNNLIVLASGIFFFTTIDFFSLLKTGKGNFFFFQINELCSEKVNFGNEEKTVRSCSASYSLSQFDDIQREMLKC